MKKIIIPIILFVGITFSLFAQKSNKEIRGDKSYTIYAFDKAIDLYTHAKQLTVEGQRRLAESYHHNEQNIEAEAAYLKLTSLTEGVTPEDHYNYAMVLKANAKYDLANQSMDKFQQLKPNDLRAMSFSAHRHELSGMLKDDGKFKVDQLNINTNAQDFGASYFNNQIVFASSREIPTKSILRLSNWKGKPYLDMYVSKIENGQIMTPENFNTALNGKMNDGPASFSNDGTFMAFSRNNYDVTKKDKIVKLQIFFSNFKDGKWSTPESFPLNNKDYSVGHPFLTADGKTMYFVSDMPGGFGGGDIYRTTKDASGKWSTAINLGNTINTEGDEVFPFFEEIKELLFFSSNGRFGLGGLDVFIAEMNGTAVGRTYNAGSPMNTQFDDFSVILDGKTNKGYLSSNRSGGKGDDDIYSFDVLKELRTSKTLKGIAKNSEGTPIPRTFITLFDDKGNVIDTITTKDGYYTFSVGTDKSFKLVGNKDNYIDGDVAANTFSKDQVVKADVMLLKKEVVAKKIQVGADLGKILEFNPNKIYFDYAKFNIRPDAEIELAKIIKIMNDYPKMVVELGSNADCRAPKGYNQALSNKRAKASADYVKKRISNPERIYGKGYGETKLVNGCECEGKVVSDCSDVDHEKNRRTEFIIVKTGLASK